jgi:hypothetical protein
MRIDAYFFFPAASHKRWSPTRHRRIVFAGQPPRSRHETSAARIALTRIVANGVQLRNVPAP